MSKEKLIQDYLDGVLDSGGTEEFFKELHSSPELNMDLNTYMKMDKLAAQDVRMTTTPVALTNSVFKGLGYSLPVADINKSGYGLRKYSILLLLLLFMGISVTAYYLIDNGKLSNIADNSSVTNDKANRNIPVTESKSNDLVKVDNVVSGVDETDRNSNSLSQNYKNSDKLSSNLSIKGNKAYRNNQNTNSINRDNKSDKSNNSVNDEGRQQSELSANQITASQPVSGHYQSVNNNIRAVSFQDSRNLPNIFVPNFYNSGNYVIDNTKYQFFIRTINPLSQFPDNTLTKSNSNLDNFSLGLWYNYSDDFSLGLELGKEVIAQEFTTGENLVYLQSPDLMWAGVGIRYSPKELLIPYLLYPYFQQVVAATTIGPLLKSQTGMIWRFYGPLSLNLGVEYGILFYNVDSKIYNSGKFNIIGGITVSF